MKELRWSTFIPCGSKQWNTLWSSHTRRGTWYRWSPPHKRHGSYPVYTECLSIMSIGEDFYNMNSSSFRVEEELLNYYELLTSYCIVSSWIYKYRTLLVSWVWPRRTHTSASSPHRWTPFSTISWQDMASVENSVSGHGSLEGLEGSELSGAFWLGVTRSLSESLQNHPKSVFKTALQCCSCRHAVQRAARLHWSLWHSVPCSRFNQKRKLANSSDWSSSLWTSFCLGARWKSVYFFMFFQLQHLEQLPVLGQFLFL